MRKIYVIGHAQHGKTTVAKMLSNILECTYADSSLFVIDTVVRPYLEKHRGLIYRSSEAAHADRNRCRPEWKDAIEEYNSADASRLSRDIFSKHRIYCGCRTAREYLAGSQALNAIGIYVDASERVEKRDETFGISVSMADVVLDNSWHINYTEKRLMEIVSDFKLTKGN